MSHRDREDRRGTSWTIVLTMAGFLVALASVGLVSPRSRHAAERASEIAIHPELEPPPSLLAVPRPSRGDRTSPRSIPAGESALEAVGAGPGPSLPPAPLKHAPGSIELEVVVRQAGRAEPGALVELVHESSLATSAMPVPALHRTDAEGRVHVALEPGRVRAVAWSEDACALPAEAALDTGSPARLELELEPAFPIGGRVVDAATGAPVAGASVALWTFAERDVVVTGADGSFLHPRFPARAPAQQIAVSAAGYGKSVRYLRIGPEGDWKLSAARREEPSLRGSGTPWIELELVAELRVSGRVLGPDGNPVAGARIGAEGFFQVLPSVASRDLALATSDELGLFELVGLRSDVSHSLWVSSEGLAIEPLELEAPATALDVGTLVLARECAVAGAVVDEDGRPLDDVEVVLHVVAPAGPTGPRTAPDVGARIQGRELRTRTTPEGTFLFTGLAPHPVTLTVEPEDGERLELRLEPRPDGSYDAPCLVVAATAPAAPRTRAELPR